MLLQDAKGALELVDACRPALCWCVTLLGQRLCEAFCLLVSRCEGSLGLVGVDDVTHPESDACALHHGLVPEHSSRVIERAAGPALSGARISAAPAC